MKIERIQVNFEEMLDKSYRFRKIIKNNGMAEVFLGVDSQGNKIFEIKHTRPPQHNSTIIIEIYGGTRSLIGGGNSSYADNAFFEALRAIGFAIDGINVADWQGLSKAGVEEVMQGVMRALGCKQAIKVFKVDSE